MKINHRHYTFDELSATKGKHGGFYLQAQKEVIKSDQLCQLALFYEDFLSERTSLKLKTSGSTGAPKAIIATKKQLRSSAALTCSFLDLKSGQNALLCLPMRYIAGKMMAVRALLHDLHLIAVTPCANPLLNCNEDISFAAFTPMQVQEILKSRQSLERFASIHKIIIGGAPISPQLELQLRSFDNQIYASYGMTETLSHIALRQVSGSYAKPYFKPLPGIRVFISEKGTLGVDAPMLHDGILITNDIAVMHDNGFEITGRLDNVINSGGIKLQLEQIELKLGTVLNTPFALSSTSDERLGQALVMICQGEPDLLEYEQALQLLARCERPKALVRVAKLPVTHSGKLDRQALKLLALGKALNC